MLIDHRVAFLGGAQNGGELQRWGGEGREGRGGKGKKDEGNASK